VGTLPQRFDRRGEKADLEIKRLENGEYSIPHGGSADGKLVSDVLKLSLPIADTKLI